MTSYTPHYTSDYPENPFKTASQPLATQSSFPHPTSMKMVPSQATATYRELLTKTSQDQELKPQPQNPFARPPLNNLPKDSPAQSPLPSGLSPSLKRPLDGPLKGPLSTPSLETLANSLDKVHSNQHITCSTYKNFDFYSQDYGQALSDQNVYYRSLIEDLEQKYKIELCANIKARKMSEKDGLLTVQKVKEVLKEGKQKEEMLQNERDVYKLRVISF